MSRIGITGTSGDAGREHRDFLHFRRQRCHMIYAGHGKQLADLLEADFRLAARDHGADSLTASDKPAFTHHLVGYSQALIKLRGKIVAAYAGGVRDGLRLQKRAFQRVDRADVRLTGLLPAPPYRWLSGRGEYSFRP